MERMRLDKFLAEQGIGSRSQVKEMVRKGLVKVNDITVKKADIQVNEKTDKVAVNGQNLCMNKPAYLMLHKPAGVVSATTDTKERTVMDLLPPEFSRNYFPVGRLEKYTEGLLLITDDGVLAHNLLSPKHHVDKTYYVEVNGMITDDMKEILEQGVDIGDDTNTLPAVVSDRKIIPTGMSFLLTITEGRFHQIKRMVQAIGFEVTYLKRLSMGSLQLDDNLEKGRYRALTLEEIQVLKAWKRSK